MTDATQAAAIAREFGEGALLTNRIADALAQARAAEREACIAIVKEHCAAFFEPGNHHASNGIREAVEQIEARAREEG